MHSTMFQPSGPSVTTPQYAHSLYHSDAPDAPYVWRPLPSVLIDFIAITLCDVIPFRMQRRRSQPHLQHHQQQQSLLRNRSLPELVYFIHKITYQAGINVRTAIVALILLDRAKAALPKNAVSSYDTSHRLLLGALLIASKMLRDTVWAPPPSLPQLTNGRLCALCNGLYSLNDINQLERAFLKLIQYKCWVDDKDVNEYVVRHRTDLAL